METLPWHILSVLFSRKIICTFRTIVEVRGCCMSSIEFYSFLHIIKGNNMKTNHIMGCFHKQVVNVDYECPFH